MEGDGSFSLKNLGKGSIFLNGKEVTIGQLVSLSSSNLIEVNGFLFFWSHFKSLVTLVLFIPCSGLSHAYASWSWFK